MVLCWLVRVFTCVHGSCDVYLDIHIQEIFSLSYSGVFRIWQRGAWRVRRARAYNRSLGAEPPAGSRGRAPGWRVRGRSPPEAETLFAFERSIEAANSPIFFWNLLENGKRRTFSYKVACKKFSWSGQRGGRPGGIALCLPPLNMPLRLSCNGP